MDTVSPKTEIHLHPQPSEPSVGVYESYFKPGTLGLEELHTVLFNHQQLVSVTKCSGARMARKKRPCHQSQIYAESRLPRSKERLNYCVQMVVANVRLRKWSKNWRWAFGAGAPKHAVTIGMQHNFRASNADIDPCRYPQAKDQNLVVIWSWSQRHKTLSC